MKAEYPCSESGLELLANIEKMFKDNGGYNLYKFEVELENKINKFSPSAKLLKDNIRRLKYYKGDAKA